MGLRLVTPPLAEPLVTDELLEHLRELDADQAGYVVALGVAAREYAETYCRRAFLTQTWTLTRDGFPCDRTFLRLPRPPLQSVTSVRYVDAAGTLTTWGSSNYVVDTVSLPGRLHLAYGQSWPTVRAQANAVEITFVAGYGNEATAVPESLKHGLKLLVGSWYEHREPVVTGTIATKIPLSVEAILGQFRVMEF